MKHFRLKYLLLTILIVASGAVTALLAAGGHTPQAILTGLVGATAIIAQLALSGRLIRMMNMFVKSLEAGDTTMTFDFGRSDRQMAEMGESMNRLLAIYRDNVAQLETRKLYYDRILTTVTHEMRNSIAPVAAVATDMQANPERYTGPTLAEAIDLIADQSSSIKTFLDSYYTLTHLPAPEREIVTAGEFVDALLPVFGVEAAERSLPADVITLTVARDMKLDIDRRQLTRAVVNLVRNALDAVTGREAPNVRVTVSQSDGHPFIEVADNGPGIAPQSADMIFQPFYTTKPGGSGVGLCLSRQIARLHGGDLRFVSSPGRGSRFVIVL